ncbi:serine hydrolase domain-containing protein [Novosphingobium sp. BL-52-GroH]|uniref:serine hydrolase domain-containing protein n=1 Tax=Novosphingobium sp. BL-52-GroH TaxID=3349877 RepID=UPI0038501205
MDFDPAPLRQVLDEATARQAIVGCVVCVSRHGGAMQVLAAGLADREQGLAMAPGTVFRLASLTKAVVCVAALRLVEEGRLDLADPVTRWLPWFAPALPSGHVPAISIADLMTHRSGLGYAFGQPAGTGYDAAGISDGLDDSGLTLAENMRRLAEQPLFEAPGTKWRYSLGIDLLGLILERATGEALAQIVAGRITGPLGMAQTGFLAAPDTRLATPYADGTPAPVRMASAQTVPMGTGVIRFAPERARDAHAFASGGTGLVGTAGDYARFLDAIARDGGGIVSPAMARRFVTDAVDGADVGMPGSGLGWGLGVAVLRDPGATGSALAGGSWSWGGVYGNSYWVDPQAGISVVALTNTALAGMAGPFPEAVRQAVYAGLGG